MGEIDNRTLLIEKFMDKYKMLDKNRTMFSIGCGSGKRENYFTKKLKKIDCINHPTTYNDGGWKFKDEFKKNKKLNCIVADFVTMKISKKYDIIFSSESLQFILNEHLTKIDKAFFNYFENKLDNMLNPNGYIVISMIQKKFFSDRKKQLDDKDPSLNPNILKSKVANDKELNNKYFIQSLTESIKIIKKMKFKVIHEEYFQNKQMKILILKKEVYI